MSLLIYLLFFVNFIVPLIFTFQYVSINMRNAGNRTANFSHLHSNMSLLIFQRQEDCQDA